MSRIWKPRKSHSFVQPQEVIYLGRGPLHNAPYPSSPSTCSIMLTSIFALLVSFSWHINAQNTSTSEIIPLLRQANLVPKVLPEFNATVGPLIITYPNAIVNYGNNVSVASVAYSPDIEFPAEADFPNYKYVFAIIDPDAPTPQNPTSAQIRHYLVADVSPQSTVFNVSSGSVLSPYKSPAPPAGSAAHRYTSVLLRQQPGATVSLYNQSSSTSNFNLTQFAQQNNLTFVSANYFNASTTTTSSTSSSSGGSSMASSSPASNSVTPSTSTSAGVKTIRGSFDSCIAVIGLTYLLTL